MFKIGDKIRCIKDTGWCGVRKGDIYTFLSYGESGNKFLKLEEHAFTKAHANDESENWELVKENQMNKPHKHAELIKQWAMGAEIQYQNTFDEWISIVCPDWHNDYKFRIKPEPKPDFFTYGFMNNLFAQSDYPQLSNNAGVRSSHDNVMFTFDGETGKLKAVELLDTKN